MVAKQPCQPAELVAKAPEDLAKPAEEFATERHREKIGKKPPTPRRAARRGIKRPASSCAEESGVAA